MFYFLSTVVDPPMVIYMGKDKHENAQHDPYETTMIINPREIGHISACCHGQYGELKLYSDHLDEDLLKWGFPEDVWFHVDKLSSAHVYLRLPKGMLVDSIPESVLIDCAQLVKANSIQGSKMNNVAVVYTEFGNLKKTAGMEIGQVGFHRQKKVHTVMVEKKLNEVVNRLNRTREEKYPNLQELREKREREEQADLRQLQEEKRLLEQEQREKMKCDAELKSYKSIMVEDNMESNQYTAEVDYKAVEDDFM